MVFICSQYPGGASMMSPSTITPRKMARFTTGTCLSMNSSATPKTMRPTNVPREPERAMVAPMPAMIRPAAILPFPEVVW